MRYQEYKEILLEDKMRCYHNSISYLLYKDFIFWFRLASYLYSKSHFYAPIRRIITCIYNRKQIKYGIQLPIGTEIGGGLKFVHYSGIVFAKGVKVGKNCTIHQGVTLGRGFSKCKDKYPIIDDGVVFFANTVTTGNVKVGTNSIILANCVVTKDVPPNSIVGGIPSKIVGTYSDNIFDEYGLKVFKDY